MKCARCVKEFPCEFHGVQQRLEQSGLDCLQQSFLLLNFGGPICTQYGDDLKSAFYASGINPSRKIRKAVK